MHDTSEYLYVVVDANGNCHAVGDNARKETPGLATLLHDRWRPIREVPFGETPQILILLERGWTEPGGFGFRA